MSALPFPGNPGEAVPEVDAADFKAVWEAYREAQSHRPPGEQTALGMGLLTHCCSPGANVPAVSYRAMFLRAMIEYMPELAAHVKDGQPRVPHHGRHPNGMDGGGSRAPRFSPRRRGVHTQTE